MTLFSIDWSSISSDILINSRLPHEEREEAQKILHVFNIPGHIWISSSGSTGNLKWVALSKQALLASAAAVNTHLESTSKDCWLNPLPHFHVGGLGIFARAHLSQAKIVLFDEKWDPRQFPEVVQRSQATLTSLVPTQVFDLVTQHLEAPKSLRAIIVGGGALSAELYTQARALGWPLLPSYGLTECSSQVATASLASLQETAYPSLSVLSHVEVKINEAGYICVKSPALLTGYAISTPEGLRFINPTQDGWYTTEDLGEIDGVCLKVRGRDTDFIKIGGESVDMSRLDKILEKGRITLGIHLDVALIAVPDERLGHVIHLATASSEQEVQPLVTYFQNHVLPFEKIRKVHLLPSIPRSPLGKVQRAKLLL